MNRPHMLHPLNRRAFGSAGSVFFWERRSRLKATVPAQGDGPGSRRRSRLRATFAECGVSRLIPSPPYTDAMIDPALRIGIVGATGAVGRVTLAELTARGHTRIRAFASRRSAGTTVDCI